MSPSAAGLIIPILSAVLLLSSATTSAFNITVLLSRYPGFEQFNQLLSRTHLAEEINQRRTITVLGLPNDRIGTIMQMPEDVQKSILSLHVVLDYFDMIKLNSLAPATRTSLTTLYQSSGVANDKQGFIDVVRRRDSTIVFGSSMQGAPLVAALVNSVYAQPYNISLLSVSQPIIAPGMDGYWPVEPASALPPKADAPSPLSKKPPTPAMAPVAEEPVADGPITEDASAPSLAEADAPATGPAADAPAEDGAEEDDGDEAAEGLKKKSAAVKQVVSGVTVGLVIGLASFLV